MATLGYWGFRGIAQPIRFLLAYLGVEYTEKTYSTNEEWFKVDKNSLGLELPNIPYFIDNEIKLTESQAIPFYLIKKYKKVELLGLKADGSFSQSEIRIQQLIGALKDIIKELLGLCSNPNFENVKAKEYQDKLGVSIQKITAFLGNKQFLVDTLSYADFIFYELLCYFNHIFPASITPTLAAYIDRFENLPGIKQYLAKPTVNLKVFLPPTRFVWYGPK